MKRSTPKNAPTPSTQFNRRVRSWVLAALLSAIAGAAGCFGAQPSSPPPAAGNKQTLYYIPHTHWEGAVFKTREDYLAMGMPRVLQVLRLMKEFPEYTFTLDQVCLIKPFLERYPEEAPAFRRFVAEGRLGIVGGMDVMPDVVKPGGEMFVRQMQYGKRYLREELGVDVTTGWLLDTFGHHPQIPQLLRQAGYKSFWFCRGVAYETTPAEFLWQGIDGTQIQAFYLPFSYGLFYGPPRKFPQFKEFFQKRFDSLNPYVHGTERVGLAGVDVSEPEDHVPPLIAEFNRQPDAPFIIRPAVPAQFEAVVARRTNQPVITGDLSPIFQGTYSSRIELKQTTRELEQRLLTAEKFSAIASWLGMPADDAMLWRAWEPVMFNQTHDLSSGVMTDVVYEDTVRSYGFSKRLTEEVIEGRWESIAARIDTRGEGIPVVVFNTLSWPRTDVAEVELGFAQGGVRGVGLVDSAGNTIPVQLQQTERYGDGAIKRAWVTFVAHEVRALGYAVYRARPEQAAAGASQEAMEDKQRDFIENEHYRAVFNRDTGAITSLVDKSTHWEVLTGPANVIAREQDKGDLWELYRGLDGGSHIAMTNQQPVPRPSAARFSNEQPGTNGVVRCGPVFSEFSVAHPFANGSFATRVRLYAGLPRLDIQTELVNNEKYVRYQALFPTSISKGRSVVEIPFGAVERPPGIEFPAQHWVDYSDGQRGVALLNFGLPGNLVTDGTLMLSLMRSHNLGAYGYGGGYEPGMSAETGFELGQQRSFHYAIEPHAGDWRAAKVYRSGMEFNCPLVVHKAGLHAGALPNRWGLLEISAPNVVLTAFKPGKSGTTVLRVYEAVGNATPGVKLKVNAKIVSAHEANLLEESGREVKFAKNTLDFDLRPYEIKTLKLQLRPQAK
jgi:alpha-mannosidase